MRTYQVDPAEYNVVIGAGVLDTDSWQLPRGFDRNTIARFELIAECSQPAGWCRRIDGLYGKDRVVPNHPVTLVGCEPLDLLRVFQHPQSWSGQRGELHALDRHGRRIFPVALDLEVTRHRRTRPALRAQRGHDRPGLLLRLGPGCTGGLPGRGLRRRTALHER